MPPPTKVTPPEIPPLTDEEFAALVDRLTTDERFAEIVRSFTPAPSLDPRWEQLRAPFPDSQVGKLPRVYCRACSDNKQQKHCENHQLAQCRVCRNRITTAHLHLDYVGHAAVTKRLLEVDPTWNWEPQSFDQFGLPLVDAEGGMWIRLTVLGVTRLGYGTDTRPSHMKSEDSVKILIGDALRNAALRFGVALDLWSKEDLSAKAEAEAEAKDEVDRGLTEDPNKPPPRDWISQAKACTTIEQVNALATEANNLGEFQGAAKAAMAGKRRQLEADAKRQTAPPASE